MFKTRQEKQMTQETELYKYCDIVQYYVKVGVKKIIIIIKKNRLLEL